jgi:FlaG/FlaF family flagellin (archaellin)
MLKILVTGDWHIGSHYGLMLPEYDDPYSGMTIRANPLQTFLFENFCQMLDLIGEVDIVILNGDTVEGQNKREKGIGVWTTDIHAQANCASVIADMIRCRKIYCSQGSPYHTENPTGDKIVCDKVNGEWIGDWHFIEINNNLTIYLKHHGDFSSIPYARCTAQRKQSMIAKSQGTNVDIFINSHTHHFNFSGDSSDLSISIPCWKGIDPYIGKKSIEQPDNGYVLINVDGPNYTWTYNIFKIPFQLYNKTIKITEKEIKQLSIGS